ncbi:helix-turn-helix domain-containing protein [Bacteroidota bacterium]
MNNDSLTLNNATLLKNVLSSEELSQILGIDHDTLAAEIEKGNLPCKKIGNSYFITKTNCLKFIRKPNIGIISDESKNNE